MNSRSETDPALRALARLLHHHDNLVSVPSGEPLNCDEAMEARAALAAAEAAPLDGTGSGTTTDCTQEDVHVHPFRGPHRFTEWYPIPAAEAAPLIRQRCANCGETDYIVDDAALRSPDTEEEGEAG